MTPKQIALKLQDKLGLKSKTFTNVFGVEIYFNIDKLPPQYKQRFHHNFKHYWIHISNHDSIMICGDNVLSYANESQEALYIDDVDELIHNFKFPNFL